MNKLVLSSLFLLLSFGAIDAHSDIYQRQISSFYFIDTYNNKVNAFSSETGSWSSVVYGGQDRDIQIIISEQNYSFVDPYNNKVFAYCALKGSWASVEYGGQDSDIVIETDNGNFVFQDIYNNSMNAFSSQTGTWSKMSYGGQDRDISIRGVDYRP